MTGPISLKRAATWAGLIQAIRVLTQLVGLLVLARLLAPSDYGLMAIASAIIIFASMFREMGTGTSIIQKEEVDDLLTSSVFWFNILAGSILMAILYFSSPLVGQFFGDPELDLVLKCISPIFIISAAGSVSQALFERDSDFRTLAVVEVASSILALGTAIWAALSGLGVYALVIQSCLAAAASSCLLLFKRGWVPLLLFDWGSIKSIWSFSGNLFAFNVLNYFQRNADTAIIGRYLSSTDLGIYNIAYRILLFPLQNITFVIARASLPIYSRNQGNLEALSRHYLSTVGRICTVTAPLMAIFWISREPIIYLLFGAEWIRAADIVLWLAPVGFIQSMVSTSGSILSAIGQTSVLRRLGFASIFFLVVPLIAGLSWGLEGVAAGYCIGNIFWAVPVFRAVLEKLNCGPIQLLRHVCPPALAALFSLLLVLWISERFSLTTGGSLTNIIWLALPFASVYALLIFALHLGSRTLSRAKV